MPGRGKYGVPQEILRASGLDGRTSAPRRQPDRLRALILEGLERHPDSSSSEVLGRAGPEVPTRTFSRALKELVDGAKVVPDGKGRWTRYRIAPAIGHGGESGR